MKLKTEAEMHEARIQKRRWDFAATGFPLPATLGYSGIRDAEG
jgi:hypothetical protein